MTTKYFHTSFKLDWNFVKIPGNYKELVSFFCSVFLCPYWSGALFSCCKPVGNSLVLWAISTTRPSLALSSFSNVKDCDNWCSSCPTAVACWERERERRIQHLQTNIPDDGYQYYCRQCEMSFQNSLMI